MNAETKKFISLCKCPEIQDRWVPKFKDEFYCKPYYPKFGFLIVYDVAAVFSVEYDTIRCISAGQGKDGLPHIMHFHDNPVGEFAGLIFLPSLDQLIDMLGERFGGLDPAQKDKFLCWRKGHHQMFGEYGSSRRIAAIKACLEVRKEEKSDG